MHSFRNLRETEKRQRFIINAKTILSQSKSETKKNGKEVKND